MDCSTPGFPVYHQLLELAQTHVHRVGDAIQPSLPLSSPSPPAFNLSQRLRPCEIDGDYLPHFPDKETKAQRCWPRAQGWWAGPLWLCCQWLLGSSAETWQEVILNPKSSTTELQPRGGQSPFPISSSQHHWKCVWDRVCLTCLNYISPTTFSLRAACSWIIRTKVCLPQ